MHTKCQLTVKVDLVTEYGFTAVLIYMQGMQRIQLFLQKDVMQQITF